MRPPFWALPSPGCRVLFVTVGFACLVAPPAHRPSDRHPGGRPGRARALRGAAGDGARARHVRRRGAGRARQGGTGKTTALDAARELWERDGHRVVGAALSGRAADELRCRAGLESYTIHGLLQDLDRGGEYGLAAGAVLVIDEAGMVSTRTCDRLLAHADAAKAKVVLVGDERQLAAIDAGGALKGLAGP